MVQRIPPSAADEVSYVVNTPQCLSCAHFQGNGICTAFPGGIPDVIYLNLADHRRPYRGDHGIRFAPLPGVAVDDGA